MKKCANSRYRRYPYSRERALDSSRRNGGSPVAVAGGQVGSQEREPDHGDDSVAVVEVTAAAGSRRDQATQLDAMFPRMST